MSRVASVHVTGGRDTNSFTSGTSCGSITLSTQVTKPIRHNCAQESSMVTLTVDMLMTPCCSEHDLFMFIDNGECQGTTTTFLFRKQCRSVRVLIQFPKFVGHILPNSLVVHEIYWPIRELLRIETSILE